MINRSNIWIAAAVAVAIFGVIQWHGGAYSAEFDGHPDEPSHFVTALMLRDYALTWPWPNPVPWVEQYYLHYPRVALGQWPPLYHLLLGAWWIVFPVSRETAILLQGLLAFCTAMVFHRVASRAVAGAIATFVTGLLIASPLFQRGATQVMAEQLNLLLAVLLLEALAGFVESEGQGGRTRIAALIGLSLLVKGTGLALIPAPAFALVLSGQARRLRTLIKPALGAAVVIGACAAWYIAANRSASMILGWAGVTGNVRWNWKVLKVLTGWGGMFTALARWLTPPKFSPLDSASMAVVISVVSVSFVIRAMDADRHWIAAMPALLLLCASVLSWAREVKLVAAAACGLAIIAWFPGGYYRQETKGMAEIVNRVTLPARVLISSADPGREGTWVAALAVKDRRPESVIVRSTRGIASESFAGDAYRLTVEGTAGVEAYLDRHAIGWVIHDDSGETAAEREHHRLIRELMRTSTAWTEHANAGKIKVFRRVHPPRLPREPLRIHLRLRGRTIVEKM